MASVCGRLLSFEVVPTKLSPSECGLTLACNIQHSQGAFLAKHRGVVKVQLPRRTYHQKPNRSPRCDAFIFFPTSLCFFVFSSASCCPLPPSPPRLSPPPPSHLTHNSSHIKLISHNSSHTTQLISQNSSRTYSLTQLISLSSPSLGFHPTHLRQLTSHISHKLK